MCDVPETLIRSHPWPVQSGNTVMHIPGHVTHPPPPPLCEKPHTLRHVLSYPLWLDLIKLFFIVQLCNAMHVFPIGPLTHH